MDPDEYRSAALDQWEASARAWGRRALEQQRMVAPTSLWMIEAIAPQPGQTVLELAAGAGETGFLAAELVRPGGKLVCSDWALPMLDVARERAQQLDLDNVEFRRLDAESLDLEAASVDGVLCRWGYMLMADPAAALRETRRVLRPGGRVALAVWSQPERNPWIAIAGRTVRERAGAPEPEPGAPGMFALGEPGLLEEMLADAGFAEARVEPLELTFEHPSFEDWLTLQLELGKPLADLVQRLDAAEREATRELIRERVAPFTREDGSLAFPSRQLLASAGA